MLCLQPDEALNSFYSRLVFFLQNPKAKYLDSLFGVSTNFTHWTPAKARTFTYKIGWGGHKEFNFLLNRHTTYHRYEFSVDSFGCYDQYIYWKKSHFGFAEYIGLDPVRFCPLCVREDYESLGFIYWRRNHQARDVTVCGTHNLELFESCGGCSRPYETKNNYLDIQWVGCECGFDFLQVEAKPNHDQGALRLARFLDDLYRCEFQIYTRDRYRVINHQINKIGLRTAADYYDYLGALLRPKLLSVLFREIERNKDAGASYLFSRKYEYMASLFCSFDEMSLALDEIGAEKYPISKSCYHATY